MYILYTFEFTIVKKISATYLKQNTRKVIDSVIKDSTPAVIYNHNEPKAVIIDYKDWKRKAKIHKKPSIEQIKKLSFATKNKINSAEIIRKWRDEE